MGDAAGERESGLGLQQRAEAGANGGVAVKYGYSRSSRSSVAGQPTRRDVPAGECP